MATDPGATEIAKSRDNAWAVVVERKHAISRAFAGREGAQELVLLGSVRMKLINGKSVDSGFASHVKLETGAASSAQPRMAFMEVFAVSHIMFLAELPLTTFSLSGWDSSCCCVGQMMRS